MPDIEDEGPPTLADLLRKWWQEDPILHQHLFLSVYQEGTYFESCCPENLKHSGYALALIPAETETDQRVTLFIHGQRNKSGRKYYITYCGLKVKGYLRREDPQFFKKLKRSLIKSHDAIYSITKCKIKWEFGEIPPEEPMGEDP